MARKSIIPKKLKMNLSFLSATKIRRRYSIVNMITETVSKVCKTVLKVSERSGKVSREKEIRERIINA